MYTISMKTKIGSLKTLDCEQDGRGWRSFKSHPTFEAESALSQGTAIQGPRTWEQGCNFCFKGGFLGLLGIVFQFDAMIMNIFDVICYPWRLCALFPPSHLCVPVILVLLGFGLDLNLFNSFECSTLSWAEILKCCSNECCLCCPWIYLLVSLVPLLEVYLGENPLYFQLAWKCRIVGLLWILSGSAGKESTQNQIENVKILLETQQGVHG